MAESAVKQQPENQSYLDTYGWILFMMGKYSDAREWINKAIVLGSIVKHTGNWDLTFYVTGGLYFVGATCWLFINSTKPLPQDQGE